jgi:hypothetical protein
MPSNESMAAWERIATVIGAAWLEAARLWNTIPEQDRREVLVRALETVSRRREALGWLLLMPDNTLREDLFSELVDLASVGHSDIGRVRDVIKSMPRQWVLDRIQPVAQAVLDRQSASGAEDRYEEFRRFAELFVELDVALLRPLVERSLRDKDSDVREVGEDFKSYL